MNQNITTVNHTAPAFFTPSAYSTHANTMLQAALGYAALGWHVFPCHAPIFDNDGACVGCTCEAWKRTQAIFGNAYKCPQPGKCPAVRWSEKSTADPKQLAKWFGHQWKTTNENGATIYFTPNIAVDCGKSGLLALDDDAYKKVYGDLSDFLSPDEQETVKAFSGSHQGSHLLYAMPTGATYGNAKGSLPPGIDVRGVGGYLCLSPSLHKSRNRYEWIEGYAPSEIALQAVPAALQAILDAAQNTVRAKSVRFSTPTPTTPTTARPALAQWHLSERTRWLIDNPAPQGKRSESDMKVIVSLVYAGASDDQILGVYQHFPIGTAGKFAESGERYLALTIGKARSFVELHPRPDVAATVDHLRLSIKTHNLGDLLPAGPGSTKFRPVVDAICDVMSACQRLSITVGKDRLAELAGCSPNTVKNGLALLKDRVFTVTPSKYGSTIALVENSRLQEFDPLLSIEGVTTGGQKTENDYSAYSAHKADDAFAVGTSRFMRKEHIPKLAQALGISPTQARADYTFAGLGEGVLLAYDTWRRVGDMSATEHAGETGIKLAAARAHLNRAEKMGLAESSREGANGHKVYTFSLDFWRKVEELTPNMRSFKLQAQRSDDRLVGAIQYAQRELQKAQPDDQAALHRRIEKLSAQRIPHLGRLNEDMPAVEVKRLAYDVGTPYGPHPATQAKLERLHCGAKMDVAAEKRLEEWQLVKTAQQLRGDGERKQNAVRQLLFAGYTRTEAWGAVQRVWRTAGGAL